jgi:hypothetical protein
MPTSSRRRLLMMISLTGGQSPLKLVFILLPTVDNHRSRKMSMVLAQQK